MFQNIRSMRRNESGLTLVELLTVVVILAIVSAITVVIIGDVVGEAKKDAHVANAIQIIEAVRLSEVTGEVVLLDGNTFVVIPETEDGGDPVIESLGTVVDPWYNRKYKKAIVSKDDGMYRVTLERVLLQGEKEQCLISAEQEMALKKQKVCK